MYEVYDMMVGNFFELNVCLYETYRLEGFS